MSKAPRQKKTDTVSSNGSAESAKDETSITDGATIMAAINFLETGIHQKFDMHAAEFRKVISSLREEVHNSLTAINSEVKAHEERLAWKMWNQSGRLVCKCLKRPWPPYRTRMSFSQKQFASCGYSRGHGGHTAHKINCRSTARNILAFGNPRFWPEPIVRWQHNLWRVSGRGRLSYAFTDLMSRRTFFGGPFKPNSSNSKTELSTFSLISLLRLQKRGQLIETSAEVKYGLRGLTGFRITHNQCWASYSKNVIYYSLLVTPFESNIVTLLITFWQQ